MKRFKNLHVTVKVVSTAILAVGIAIALTVTEDTESRHHVAAKEPGKATEKTTVATTKAVAAKPETKATQSDKVETRKTVEERKSSEARLAKGEINFDDLKFDLEKDAAMDADKITKTIKKIDGRKIKLSGYILPASVFRNDNIKQFVLVRDNQECCFGPGAALFDCVMVEMEPGKTADFATRPVTVEGKFELDLKKYAYPGGKGPRGASHYAIFRIKGVKVK